MEDKSMSRRGFNRFHSNHLGKCKIQRDQVHSQGSQTPWEEEGPSPGGKVGS